MLISFFINIKFSLSFVVAVFSLCYYSIHLENSLKIYYICNMKAMVITPKNSGEFKFISDLLKKLGIASATMTEEEIEDMGLSKMMKAVDKTKKVSKNTIMQKLK